MFYKIILLPLLFGFSYFHATPTIIALVQVCNNYKVLHIYRSEHPNDALRDFDFGALAESIRKNKVNLFHHVCRDNTNVRVINTSAWCPGKFLDSMKQNDQEKRRLFLLVAHGCKNRSQQEETCQNESRQTTEAAATASVASPTIKNCQVCLDDKNEDTFKQLSCGHSYCLECVSRMVDMAVKEQKTIDLICPTPACKFPLVRSDLASVVKNNETMAQLDGITTREWIAQQSDKKYCPTPNCSYVFTCESMKDKNKQVKCPQCTQSYCSGCLKVHEEKITCTKARRIEELMREEKEINAQSGNNRIAEQWKSNNTKPCPRCKTPISKDGGCQRITCPQCRMLFQWNS